ncbi:hypothetical protein [Bacillus salipaludis]|uniref:Uncharacterized protein n=1 Tax=Bacillus salipaludis TaxID=2547811 RepID=A0AA90QUC2_9BACI|nr:hypothetical protein [Bacillus salipaludis]MDQ6596454.1 hypothetical protein [Bacillus salipaludis]
MVAPYLNRACSLTGARVEDQAAILVAFLIVLTGQVNRRGI